jgi:hypothetical protein
MPLISVSFERLDYKGTLEQFWTSIGKAIKADIVPRRGESGWAPATEIVSQHTFLDAFPASDGQKDVVLLVDELGELHSAFVNVRNDFLRTLREVRNHATAYAIKSVIGAGTFSILRLNREDPSIAPFNISERINNSYFTIEETRVLFNQFAQDAEIEIDDAIIEDIWVKSGGYAPSLYDSIQADILV